jgi:hypothetical protein
MNKDSNSAIGGLTVLAVLLLLANTTCAQPKQNVAGHASDFSSVEYFDPPHQTQMKSRLSGAEARPLAGGLLVIKDLKLETFNTNGVPEMIVRAPHCVYDTQKGTANSPGHLRLETGDGDSHIEGDGFLWRQSSSLLTISNNVRTVIENTSETKAGL